MKLWQDHPQCADTLRNVVLTNTVVVLSTCSGIPVEKSNQPYKAAVTLQVLDRGPAKYSKNRHWPAPNMSHRR